MFAFLLILGGKHSVSPLTVNVSCGFLFFFVFFVDALFFLSFFKMYILIWLCQVLIAACGI